jgi:hypothetical protein
LQVKPHWPLVHVEEPLAGDGHGVQDVPHVLTDVSSAHVLEPHAWYPALQATEHARARQVATPPVGVGHALEQLPQWFGSESRFTHEPLQLVNPLEQLVVQALWLHTWFAEHAALQEPQWPWSLVKSVSQPLAGLRSQSP